MLKHVGIMALILLGTGSILWAEQVLPKGDPIALTQAAEFYLAPQWSPNGDQVAAAGPSYTGLYLIEFPTGTATQVSDAYSAGYGFAWSHDGTRIAARLASFENMHRKNTLVSFDLTDGSMSVLSEPRSSLSGIPRWSADDSHIFLTFADQYEDFLTQTGVNLHPAGPLLYVKAGQLTRHDPDQTSEQALLTNQSQVTSYALSPDATRIAYSTSGQQLWVANSDGSQRRSLGAGIAPAWSPNSQWITCMLTEDDGHSMLGSDLFIINIATAERLNISNTPDLFEMNPQWSPDGAWIVFDTEGRGQLFIQQVDWR